MAAKTDLTFAEINAEFAAPIFSYDAGNSDVVLSIKAITGGTYTALSDNGFLGALKKLLDGARTAQTTANDGLLEGERLDTFNPETISLSAANSQIIASTSLDFVLDYSNASIKGENI